MRASAETSIPELLHGKRISQFWLIFSTVGLFTGWLYSPVMWFAIWLTCLVWLVSTSGLLWLARNPGANAWDFYRTPYWWVKLLDFEFKMESKK